MKYWPYAAIASFGVLWPLACGDDDTATTTNPTTTTTTSTGANGGGGSGATGGNGGEGGGMCEDPMDCLACGQVLAGIGGPSELCCDSQPIFAAFLDCGCVTGCAMECGDNACMGGMPSDECNMCIGMNCGMEIGACAMDCPMGEPGCDGAGGMGGAGGGGGA